MLPDNGQSNTKIKSLSRLDEKPSIPLMCQSLSSHVVSMALSTWTSIAFSLGSFHLASGTRRPTTRKLCEVLIGVSDQGAGFRHIIFRSSRLHFLLKLYFLEIKSLFGGAKGSEGTFWPIGVT